MTAADLTPAEREFLLERVAAALSAKPFAATITVIGTTIPRAEARRVERDLLICRKLAKLERIAA